MIPFTRILCAVDFSETSARALARAAAIARSAPATLAILHVVPIDVPWSGASIGLGDPGPPLAVVPPPVDEVTARLFEWIAATGHRPDGLTPEVRVVYGRPADAIVETAASIGADLVVIGTHGRGGLRRFVLGSVAERVMQTAESPLLTVPPAAFGTARVAAFEHVLCPLDFSPASTRALAVGASLAASGPPGRLTVMHAVEYLDEQEPCEHVPIDIRRYRQHLIDHARERLQAAVAAIAAPPVDQVVVVGRAYREILTQAAERQVDLIVMGKQGTGGLELLVYGSNAQHVVRAARCPVLTVHA